MLFAFCSLFLLLQLRRCSVTHDCSSTLSEHMPLCPPNKTWQKCTDTNSTRRIVGKDSVRANLLFLCDSEWKSLTEIELA